MSYQSEVYKMISNLFDLWKLTETQRLELLGIPEKDKMIFNDYLLGLPIPDSFGITEREVHLLAIHQYLGLLFLEHPDLAHQWISQSNKSFNGPPLNFAVLKGLDGLIEIRNYLSNACQD